jgi:hypothetical protein
MCISRASHPGMRLITDEGSKCWTRYSSLREHCLETNSAQHYKHLFKKTHSHLSVVIPCSAVPSCMYRL